MSSSSDCVFCKIVSHAIPAQIVHEDQNTVAFLDIAPRSAGHTVVISKTHAPTLLELPESQIAPLFLTVKRLTGILQNTLHCDGFTIGINHGEEAGQTVNHLHIHIMPRFKGDGGSNMHGVVNKPPIEPLAVIAEKIRTNNKNN